MTARASWIVSTAIGIGLVAVVAAQAAGVVSPKNGAYAGTCGPKVGRAGLCSLKFTVSRLADGRIYYGHVHYEPPSCQPRETNYNIVGGGFVTKGRFLIDPTFTGDYVNGVSVDFKKPTVFTYTGRFVSPTSAAVTVTATCDAGSITRTFTLKLV